MALQSKSSQTAVVTLPLPLREFHQSPSLLPLHRSSNAFHVITAEVELETYSETDAKQMKQEDELQQPLARFCCSLLVWPSPLVSFGPVENLWMTERKTLQQSHFYGH